MHNQKILFLYLKCGGGHLSCSKTIAEYLSTKYKSKVKCVLVDGIEESKFAQYVMEDGYRISQDGWSVISETAYALNCLSGIAKTTMKMFTRLTKSHLKEVFLREKPDKVIAVHAMLTRPAEIALEELGLDTPVITLVTDPFTVHPLWLTGKSAHYVVCSDVAKRTASKKISKKRISQFPYFVNEKYSTKLPEKDVLKLKKKFGFSIDKKLILVLGGGEGIPKGKTLMKYIVKHILKQHLNAEIAIVCGRNKNLEKYCSTLSKKYSGKLNIKVYGFSDSVYELINMCDIVVTKGGPATIIEILLLEKIPIINSYIWGQEKGNVAFVVKNKLGFYQPSNKRIPAMISRLLTNESLMNKTLKNIKNIKLQSGTSQIGEFIYNYKK